MLTLDQIMWVHMFLVDGSNINWKMKYVPQEQDDFG